MKKGLKEFLAGVFIAGVVYSGIPIFASNVPSAFKFSVNSVKIALNGRTIPVDNISYNGSTYVKLSQFCAILGRDTIWDGKTKTVNIKDAPPSSTSGSSVEVMMPSVATTSAIATKPESPNAKKLAVTSAVAQENGTAIDIQFNQKVDKASAENLLNYSIKNAYGKKDPVAISTVAIDSTGTKVTLNIEQLKVAILYDLTVTNVKSETGNVMANYEGKLAGKQSAKSINDEQQPCIVAARSEGTTTMQIVFRYEMQKDSIANIANYTITSADGKEKLEVISAEVDDSLRIVELVTSKQEYKPYKIALNNAYKKDSTPADLTPFEFSGIGSHENTKPTVSSLIFNWENNSAEVQFTQKVEKVSAENISNYIFNVTCGTQSAISVSSATLDSTGSKVTLKTIGLTPEASYKISVSNVKSNFGRVMDTYSITVYGLIELQGMIADNNGAEDPNAFKMSSCEQLSSTSVKITFNKKFDEKTAQDIQNYSVHEAYGDKTALNITKAELNEDHNQVILTFSPGRTETLYVIEAKGIQDEKGNTIAPSQKVSFVIK